MSTASEWAEESCKKNLVEHLILTLACRKYNLLYLDRWKFSFHEVNGKFQVYAVNRLRLYEYGVPSRGWKLRVITLSSPVGNIEQMHFWVAGVVNVFDYIKIEGIGYPVVAIA
jgi:hypothetical protein